MGEYNNDGEELVLFAINDGRLYEEAMRSIIPNLAKKWRDGRYDKKLAVVLWEYHAAKAATRYAKEVDGSRFNRASRMVAAREFENHYREEIQRQATGGNRDRRRARRSSSARRRRVAARRRSRRYR